MFSEESKEATNITERALSKYEEHFNVEFPVFEYIDMTKGNGYDFSEEGSKRLLAFIEERIKNNQPVEIPNGYIDRVY